MLLLVRVSASVPAEVTEIIMAGNVSWLTRITSAGDRDDSVGKVTRYTLDELRFA